MQITQHQTKWAAEFIVAGELLRRGYDVTLTLGSNAPLADFIVRSPSGYTFLVDVKGRARTGRWCVKPKPDTPDLFYILVRLGIDQKGSNRTLDEFFVLHQSAAKRITKLNAVNPGLSGFGSCSAVEFRDAWETLPL